MFWSPCERSPQCVTLILYFFMCLSRSWANCKTSSTHRYIRLENSVTEHDAKIGSVMNIACFDQYGFSQWWKDGKRLLENDRVLWVQPKENEFQHKQCFKKKIVIKNITKEETGRYTCYGLKDFHKIREKKPHGLSIFINAVVCFQGYFCPSNTSLVQRCPVGTFSLHKNATSMKHCQPCPTYNAEKIRKKMSSKTVAMFRSNCRHYLSSGTKSILSKTGIIVVIVTVSLFFLLLFAFGYKLRKCKKAMDHAYNEKLFPKEIVLKKPHVARTNDVFICYSSKNSEWVQGTLHPKLTSGGFRTIIDFIDFEIGVDIHQNITKSIYGSRKTIFVLSVDSLKSFYARRELHQALAAGTTGHQVIVIQYEKCKVPVEIVHAAYFDWTSEKKEKFWGKLFEAIKASLPNESSV